MKSVMLYGVRDLRVVDREPDALGPDDVRINVSCSGICGTEIHVYSGMEFGPPITDPRPMGHEFAGRIVEVGSNVTTLSVGDRVTAIPNAACGRCTFCRMGKPGVCVNRSVMKYGAWAPNVIVPAANVYRLPDNVSDEIGALTEPLGCAVRAVDFSQLRSGDRVLVIGGGPIGLFIMAIARSSGASKVIVSEPQAYRRALAERLGADLTIDPTKDDVAEVVRAHTDGLGADVVFEAVGFPQTIETGIASTAAGGTVMVVGVTDAQAKASLAARPT